MKYYVSLIIRTSLTTILIACFTIGQVSALDNQKDIPDSGQDLLRDAVKLLPIQGLDITDPQVLILRDFLIANANRIPNLNLSQQQADAVISYFDTDPLNATVNLTREQILAIRAYLNNNFEQTSNLQLSEEDLNTILVFITNNAQNLSNLVNNNPDVAALIRTIAPQINQLARVNSQWNIIVSTLRTQVPRINALLAI